MKFAKATTSSPSSSGSGTVSQARSFARSPLGAFSVGKWGLVMPISLR